MLEIGKSRTLSALQDFLFSPDRCRQPVSALWRRAQPSAAGKIIHQTSNVLVLDEPTNDLDITLSTCSRSC